jgi:hypothetical protein
MFPLAQLPLMPTVAPRRKQGPEGEVLAWDSMQSSWDHWLTDKDEVVVPLDSMKSTASAVGGG